MKLPRQNYLILDTNDAEDWNKKLRDILYQHADSINIFYTTENVLRSVNDNTMNIMFILCNGMITGYSQILAEAKEKQLPVIGIFIPEITQRDGNQLISAAEAAGFRHWLIAKKPHNLYKDKVLKKIETALAAEI